jgi:hypothetical protein
MKTKEEIYKKLVVNIKNSTDEIWDKAILKINVAQKFSSFTGYYYMNDIKRPMRVSKFDLDIDNDLIDLHTITTAIEKKFEKWNTAYFTLKNDNNFEIEFLWDQELFDSVYKNNK